MSMALTTDLTSVPPFVVCGRNEYSEEPLYHLEIWPNKADGSDVVAFLADSLDDLDTLWQAIRDAVEKRRQDGGQ